MVLEEFYGILSLARYLFFGGSKWREHKKDIR